MFVEEGIPQPLIAEKFKISQGRISQILKYNASAVIANVRDVDKLKRIHFYNHHIANQSSKLPVARTKLDLVEAKRKEFEGDTQINIVSNFLQIETPEGVKNRLIADPAKQIDTTTDSSINTENPDV